MANSILSNYAANVATRNLAKSSTMVSASVARLSSGQRIISAKDDAAALAIGSKLRAEVDSLRQAQINAGQATAMLQIADGALTEIDNVLVRLKSLAVQAGSEQISDADRVRIDNEFQQLKNEIDRIATDTKFNGQSLLGGEVTFTGIGSNLSNTTTYFDGQDGIVGLELIGETIVTTNANTYTVAYDATGNAAGERYIRVTLANADAGEASVFIGTLPTADFAGTVTLQGSGGDGSEAIRITFTAGFAEGTDISANNTFTAAQASSASFTYKVGTGTTSTEDEITVSLDAITASGLSLTSHDIQSKANADLASTAVSNAIDTVATARAKLGAYQSRFDFASANLGTNIENSEAARSALLDVDVAAEVSKFTSQQILVQAGVSMLSQAQTLPQNLLRLFQ